MNDSAEVLLDNPVFDTQRDEEIVVVRRTVGQLGLDSGASRSAIFAAALDRGLSLCSVVTGPYLRLALTAQPSAPDTVLSKGTAPSGSLTVASAPLGDDDYPKGFYLRVIGAVPWLRGYRCTEQHPWQSDDVLIFRQ